MYIAYADTQSLLFIDNVEICLYHKIPECSVGEQVGGSGGGGGVLEVNAKTQHTVDTWFTSEW